MQTAFAIAAARTGTALTARMTASVLEYERRMMANKKKAIVKRRSRDGLGYVRLRKRKARMHPVGFHSRPMSYLENGGSCRGPRAESELEGRLGAKMRVDKLVMCWMNGLHCRQMDAFIFEVELIETWVTHLNGIFNTTEKLLNGTTLYY